MVVLIPSAMKPIISTVENRRIRAAIAGTTASTTIGDKMCIRDRKRDDWNAYDPVTVSGITHSRSEGNTEHWIGIPVENGECTLSYIPGFGMKVIWSGAGGNDTPISFPYNDDLHGALDKTDILAELIKQNNTYFEIDSKCPKSDMLTKVNEEIRKEGSSSLLGTGT